jgi:catechol 2,3-dioxygenase-like lactoylglutathione lyase family enzyme
MEVPPLPASGARPYNNPNPGLFIFFDIPGAKERHQSARVPGIRTSLEAMEIQDVDHKTIPLRIQDPGTATLVLVVRDIDAMLAQLKQKAITIATPGGKPVTFADGTRAVLVRDIDQRFIEIRQSVAAPETSAPPSSPIVDIRLSIAVNDMDRTKQVYRDVLGFKVAGETAFAADRAMRALTGFSAGPAAFRLGSAGSNSRVSICGGPRADQDRGAAPSAADAEHDALVSAVKSSGLTVVSRGDRGSDSAESGKGAGCRPEQLLPHLVRAVRRLRPDALRRIDSQRIG